MGSGASMARKIAAERQQHDEQIKETSEKLSKREAEHTAETAKLKTENSSLKEAVQQLQHDLVEERELWRQEREKNVCMMFGHLPLTLLESAAKTSARGRETTSAMLLQHAPVLNQTFPEALVACCNVVGYHRLVSKMTASEAVSLTDKLHILVDRAFQGTSMHVIEKSADCCTVVSGLTSKSPTQDGHQRPQTPVVTSATQGSCAALGSQRQATPDYSLQSEDGDHLLLPGAVADERMTSAMRTSEACRGERNDKHRKGFEQSTSHRSTSDCAAEMARSSLRLLASTIDVHIPGNPGSSQLQLRIALHSGGLHAGMMGVTQHTTGLSPDQLEHNTPVPKLHIFGNTYSEALKLRDTSLALQIRISQRFRELLLASDARCTLEQCPDFPSPSGETCSALHHTYWLVAMASLDVSLPPLDRAVPLAYYDDV